MNKIQKILYFNILTSNIGSYLTQIGLAIIVIEKYGAAKLGFIILSQSLAFIALSKSAIRYFERLNRSQLLVTINFIRGLTVGLLAFNQAYVVFLFYSVISSILGSIYGPLQRALISESLPSNEVNATFRKSSALNGASLALAPIAGVLILNHQGGQILFALDALSFFMAACTCWFLPTTENYNLQKTSSTPSNPSFGKFSFAKVYEGKLFWPAILWSLFLAVGAVHAIVEMPYLKGLSLSNLQISFIISAWGLGSLIAFFVKSKHTISDKLTVIMFGISLTAAFIFPHFSIIIGGFFCSGFMYNFIIGNLRNKIHQSAEKQNLSFVQAWSTIEKISVSVNIIFLMLSVFYFAKNIESGPIYLLLILITIFCLAYIWVINNVWSSKITPLKLE